MFKYLLESSYSQGLNSTIHRKNKNIHRKTIFLVVSIHVGISAAPFDLCYHLTGLFFKSLPLVEILLTIKNSWQRLDSNSKHPVLPQTWNGGYFAVFWKDEFWKCITKSSNSDLLQQRKLIFSHLYIYIFTVQFILLSGVAQSHKNYEIVKS